ncbi:type II secretion system protein M [Candidatus Marithioploca araucensis]|uniref:Type II secretion system protein M n=1 Tax=Candidatus Marithioploca araucensis TaxID=70273 RepID=A0ABT7VW92_9GAMM|nr:type II secretion system protein M [Candidatus Marithioploca araucensis]
MTFWLNQLAPRERRVLIIGAVTLVIMMGYFMLWEPLVTARAQLENVVAAQKTTLRWMTDAAAEVKQLRFNTSPTKTHKQSLLNLIDKSIRTGRLAKTNKRIEPKGKQEVQVRFKAVSFTALMRWLGQLYNQHQVEMSQIRIERQQAPDQVKVNLTLKYNG